VNRKFWICLLLVTVLIGISLSAVGAPLQQPEKPASTPSSPDKKEEKDAAPKKKMKKVHTLFGDTWVEDTGVPDTAPQDPKPAVPDTATPVNEPGRSAGQVTSEKMPSTLTTLTDEHDARPKAAPSQSGTAGSAGTVPGRSSGTEVVRKGIEVPGAGGKKTAPPASETSGGSSPQAPPPSAPAKSASPAASGASLVFNNADLVQVVQVISNLLRLNYIIDPAVKGVVTVTTVGDISNADLMQIMQTLLRINGATAIQTGNIWQIVPLKSAHQIPTSIERPGEKPLSADDQLVTEIIPMEFVSAADMTKILKEFLSDAGSIVSHDRGNILIITDANRNMARLFDLIRTFDSDALENQRLQLFPVKNNSARALCEDLKTIFAAYAMSEKESAIRFVPIERLNSILVVAPNPASFDIVGQWITKLDEPSQISGVRNYVYHLQYAKSADIRRLLSELYGSVITTGTPGQRPDQLPGSATSAPNTAGLSTSTLLSQSSRPEQVKQQNEVYGFQGSIKIVNDDTNNMLIIQATPQDYAYLEQTLKQIDILPRQVLIEAQIFRVDLANGFSLGVEYFLQQRGTAPNGKTPLASFAGGVLSGSAVITSAGARELFATITASENRSRTKTLSSPSILATDNQEARIQVGVSIPTLSSSGFQPGASNNAIFNTVQNVDTGVILSVTPHVSASGLVGMKITQEVSSPVPPPAGVSNISPSINRSSATTSFVVKDGETVAIAGLISEDKELTRTRIPILGDIPILGAAFGSTTYTNKRSELIIFITPHVITTLDQQQVVSDALRKEMKNLKTEIQSKQKSHTRAWEKVQPLPSGK
jgi:general secretion pathway protein D